MAEPKPHTSPLTNECHFTAQPNSSTPRFKMAEPGLSIKSLPLEVRNMIVEYAGTDSGFEDNTG